jgi:hypothetical protein
VPIRRIAAKYRGRIIFWGVVIGLLLLGWASLTEPVLVLRRNAHRPAVSSALLEAHVKMLSVVFAKRDADHPEVLDKAAAYIRQELTRAGGRMREQTFVVEKKTYRNVIAEFGPRGGDRLIVGAHYDAIGGSPGADDNASGVAGLIELARLLGETPPQACVELVAFTLEEPPYFATEQMGSAIHAADLKRQGLPVRLMLSLEMIGYFSDAKGSQRFPSLPLALLYPRRGNFIAVVGRTEDTLRARKIKKAMLVGSALPVISLTMPLGVDESDHRNYSARGYPALMITDSAYFRNPNYHEETDTFDTLDYRRMAMVVQGVYAAVQAFAR